MKLLIINDMKRNIVALDVETTGLSFASDYIIQLAAVKFDTDFNIIGEINEYILPINPNWEITEEAFGKHGITSDTIRDKGKSLKDVGADFIKFIEECDILTYNGKNFDIRMLVKDLRLVGYEMGIDRVFYDSYLLDTKLHPRTLDAVYRRYTGNNVEHAHDALHDVYATIEVFKHQLQEFARLDEPCTLDDIMEFDESKIVCLDGMIRQEGEAILFNKGKYRNTEFMEVAAKDPGYIKWFMGNSEFDESTKNTLRLYYITRKNAKK